MYIYVLLYITLHRIAWHCIAWHRVALPYIPLHYIALHSITWHYSTLQYIVYFCRRKFRSQTSDNMNRWKAEMGGVREEKRRRKKIKKRKGEKKGDPGARKGRKVAKHLGFSNDLWLRRVEVGSLGCGAMWSDERWKVARRCGAKHISKSKMHKTP